MANPGYAPPTPHILAVDNDEAVLGLFRDLLTDEGYRVTTQVYLDHDLSKIADLAPDLIILDYMWPEEDSGWTLLQLLRMNPETEGIPIILCTGAVREVAALQDHLDSMGIRVILKPFNIDQLVDVIAEVLATAAANPARVERSHDMFPFPQADGPPAKPEEPRERSVPPTNRRDQIHL